MKKPIESVFSGPAASLLGASYLSGHETCTVIDVGGTSTDVSLIHKGLPHLSEAGAVVGGWQTKVRALRMETSAMGGDSHIWVQSGNIHIGPRRVIPLCRAAVLYPDFMIYEWFKSNLLHTISGTAEAHKSRSSRLCSHSLGAGRLCL